MSKNIYFVTTARPKSGQAIAAAKWWKDKGESFFGSMSGVITATAYAVHFGLGSEFSIEIWQEIENYAVLDKWAADFRANAQNYQVFDEFLQHYEVGPSRVLGRWSETRI